MMPDYPSSQPPHPSPSLARRAMPVMALGSLAGILVFALDRPVNEAGASADGSTDVVAEDTGSEDTRFETVAEESTVDSTVPDTPARVAEEQAADTTDEQAADTTDAASDTQATTKRSTSKQTTEATTASTVKKTTTTTKSTTATTKSSSSSSCTSYKGPTISTRWGPVQVKASVSSSGKICSVSVLQHPTGRKSDSINARAIPTLNSRAKAAQSTKFSSVSGATVTSKAYKQSLQAIIDKATA